MSLLDDYEPEAAHILPVVLLLDTSGSMAEDGKIEVLNDSVTEMIEELTEGDDGHGAITLSMVTFGKAQAKLELDNVPIANVEFASLRGNGRTPMGDAFRVTRELINDKEKFPSSSYRPILALVSDGIPTDPSWEPELERLLDSDRGQKSRRLALAIGADADRDLLARFSTEEVWEASEAAQIRTFIQFVTATVTQVTLSVFEPDEPESLTETDSAESLIRLQRDDAF